MSNSKLICHTKLSPHTYGKRNHKIDTISIHCMAGNMTIESCGNLFQTRGASSNYGIGSDGRIALYANEDTATWATSNYANDNRAITIEVADDGSDEHRISDKAYKSLIKLCADVCRRNGIKKLVWSNSKADRVNHKNGCNMTVHRDYAAKSCPGDYIYNRLGKIANEVNLEINYGFAISKKVYFTKDINIYKSDCKTRVSYKSLNDIWKSKSRKGKTGKAIFKKGHLAKLKAVEYKNGKVFGVFGGKNYRILLVDKKGKKTAVQ
ncbi:MAG: N-acetylmuramoyl-L-alanine amidase [Ruminococcus sp.]